MKKILTLVALLGAFAMGANAQRSIHLKVLTNVSDGDTIIIDSVNTATYLFQIGFVNTGTDAVQEGDTLHWSTPYGSFYYPVAASALPFAMGDTLGYFNDTTSFSNGPATGPSNWCDSAWVTSHLSTEVITDPTPASTCAAIYILNRNGSSTGVFTPGLNKVNFNLFPNPTSDAVSFTYNFAKASDVNVRVMDLTGRTINTVNFGRANAGDKTFKVDVANLPAGTYMLEMVTESARGVAKFTKN